MVESDRRPNPLLEQVTQQQKTQEARKLGEVQAEQMLPDFKAKLGSLITAKVPAPEVITQKVTSFNMFDRDELEGFGHHGRRKLKTQLTSAIPLEDGATTSVTISASAYPEAENPDSVKNLDYQVDVEELDRILIIEGSKATLQSKHWEHEPFTMHTPIGVPLPSWPAWERPARAEDIQQYQALLEGLNQEGVIFKGSTPPIINRDYSEIRAKIKLPNK